VIVDSRRVKHATPGVALRAESIGRERGRVEVRLSVARVVLDLVATAIVVGHVDAGCVDSVILHLHQVVVARACKGDGKTRSKPGDTGERPACVNRLEGMNRAVGISQL
jgi:hypothetical protein